LPCPLDGRALLTCGHHDVTIGTQNEPTTPIREAGIMASMLVFVIAFTVGCLSGVVLALWSYRNRADRSKHAPSFWSTPSDESNTVQPGEPR
jgi:hypothetical protein